MVTTIIGDNVGEFSDGYHTFNELYEHRHMLFLALVKQNPSIAWKSRLHDDGTCLEGWFIAGMNLSTGTITYHLPDRLWYCAMMPELDRAPAWDGYTPGDVLDRLLLWINQT